jgi:hypothetical protein
MQRKEVNIIRKIVQQVGFIYKVLLKENFFLFSSEALPPNINSRSSSQQAKQF